MAPSLDVRRAISARPVTDGQIRNFQPQFGCAKDQIIITEGIKISKVLTVGCDQHIVLFPESFGATERVLYRLTQQPGKGQTEELVA